MAGLVVALALPAPPHKGAASPDESQGNNAGVFAMYGVILTRDVTEHGLRAGAVGRVVNATRSRTWPPKAIRSSSST
jgi:hypothetical protein